MIVPAYSGLMAAAKALIETTGNSRVVLSDWLAVSPTLRNAKLEAGNIPATARLVTSLRVHSELKLNPAKFNLVLDGYDESLVPRMGHLISDTTGAERDTLVKVAAVPEFDPIESGTEIKVTVSRTVDDTTYTSVEKTVAIA